MKSVISPILLSAGLVGTVGAAWIRPGKPAVCMPSPDPGQACEASRIIAAFGKQGIRITLAEAQGVRANLCLALQEARAHGLGNSKVDFAAVEIGQDLGLDMGPGSSTVRNIVAAIGVLLKDCACFVPRAPLPPSAPPMAWRTTSRRPWIFGTSQASWGSWHRASSIP